MDAGGKIHAKKNLSDADLIYPVPVIWGQADFERLIHTLRTASW